MISGTRFRFSKLKLGVLGLVGLGPVFLWAQTSSTDAPWFGAEVYIEPGQRAADIDTWFRRLKEANMEVTRIRLTEQYLRAPAGAWDFTLFDAAYRSAEKYGIKIYGNLSPSTGGSEVPRTEAQWQDIADYVKAVVTHFRQFKSCYGWVPVNEPGISRSPDEEFTRNAFRKWSEEQPPLGYHSHGYATFNFAEDRFLLDFNGWYLRKLVNEIRKYDPSGAIHVNPDAIFQKIAVCDLRSWTPFLTSLGGSAHASWHFGYFERAQYAVAVAANCEIIRSGAGRLPWMITELQGGNNIFSGTAPMCPTAEEISQWLWVTLGTGGKGAIFWCLNPRRAGYESGEWALLNFQNEPSDRLRMAARVAQTVKRDAALWANAVPVESGISILYTRESLWIEGKLTPPSIGFEGRAPGAGIKSALAYFEALGEMGLQARLQAIDDTDFGQASYAGRTIILSHQISLPSRSWKGLEAFVAKGGKLIVDGLTGFYDENGFCVMGDGFPLEKVFGGSLKEVQLIGNQFDVALLEPPLTLPAHLWRGTIQPTTAATIATTGANATAVRNHFGKGEVIWIPSLVRLACRIKRDYRPLAELLTREINGASDTPFRFAAIQPGMLMKTLQSGASYLTVLINKGPEKATLSLKGEAAARTPTLLFADLGGGLTSGNISIGPEEAMVIQWK